jgi:DNA-binding transcriptional LysR family regulator
MTEHGTASGAGCGANGDQSRLASDSFTRTAFTLEQIRTFLIVASREHITQSARALGLSQPAVTQQIQLLERTLGVSLLERLGRGVRLTEAGEQVAGACLLIMRALENLEQTVDSIRGLEAGTISIGATQVAASYYLAPALTAFCAAHPAVTLDITTSSNPDICDGVTDGTLECGLVDGPSLPRTKLDCAHVADDELILAVHPDHRLAGPERISLEALADSSFLIWEHGVASETILVRLLGQPYPTLPRIRMANIEAARRTLLADHRFVAAIPRIAVADDLGKGTLALAGRRTLTRPIWAIRRPGGSSSRAAAEFWDVLAGLAG